MGQHNLGARGDSNGATQRYVRNADEPTSTAVTMAVTDVLDHDVGALQPLEEVLDVDALDSMTGSSDGSVQVEFEYEGCLVTVRRGTEIFVTPNT